MIKATYHRIIDRMPIGVRVGVLYFREHGSFPHLSSPRKFTEVVQNRKVYERDRRLPKFADKVIVKDYVRQMLGAEWIIPTLWHGPELPPREERSWPLPFVLKANHASGENAFIRSESDLSWDYLEELAKTWLQETYGHRLGEWHYSEIKPQLLVEPYLGELSVLPIDYKLWTFHGRVQLIQVDTGRATEHKRCFYSRDWIKQPFGYAYPIEPSAIERPATLDAMIQGAEKLAAGLEFVRVDFYEINQRPLFGEMTFYPDSGTGKFTDDRIDYRLGQLWLDQ
ncbi:ATP-grasp fold amidoligase family protein [Microvirga splendida]|uniref:TupA-like ATPgrasp n=1 Tax=Microvirga splendida TaxID=2795727 RepID=A0ABS0Y8A8_9HYPH|nr:ATP-grasp fold amidoligase family protein [Microvirga splendida]MBJ6128545.1 hypothetical protein [Microvirga splendida]